MLHLGTHATTPRRRISKWLQLWEPDVDHVPAAWQ
jgi:hypothetical protein